MAVGRDPEVAIHLPDHDRVISRRHLTLEWADGGVRVNVLSKVNGVTTPSGEFGLGQTVIVAPGQIAQIGRFTFLVEEDANAAAVAEAAAPHTAIAPPAAALPP